jgi:soluble lytic murein transglycosylase
MSLSMPDKQALRLTATLAALLASGSAFAQTPQARILPPGETVAPVVQSSAQFLSGPEFSALARGMEAAEDGEWGVARGIQAGLTDPAARKLLQWRIATSDERSTFFELSNAVRNLQGWPNTNAMRRDAEYALGDMAADAVSSEDVVRWFTDFPGQSGEGKAAHAEALMRVGQRDAAEEILRDAWRQDAMRDDTQARLIALYSDLFTQEDTLERIDYLAFAGQRNAVRQLIPLLPSEHQALYRARLALAGDDSNAVALLGAVPQSLQKDAGLLYERARRLRRNGDEDEAVAVLRQIETNPKSLTGLSELWDLRHVLARETLEAGNPQAAYDLVRDIGADSGGDFADAEFLAGWIALRFLDDAATAEQHFVRLAEGVSTPVSVSRGWYWTGRAREAAGDAAGAQEAYRRAATPAPSTDRWRWRSWIPPARWPCRRTWSRRRRRARGSSSASWCARCTSWASSTRTACSSPSPSIWRTN